MRIIYTAIAGEYDTIKGQANVTFAEPFAIAPVRTAKRIKILAHEYLNCKYSMWIDGSVTLGRVDWDELIANYLANSDIAVLRHPDRNCLYKEAETAIALRLDYRDVIECQVKRYKEHGHPEHWGLAETGIVLRRHTERIKEFNLAWWHEVDTGSRRCQISFPYVLKKLDIPCTYIEGRPFFTVGPHLKPR